MADPPVTDVPTAMMGFVMIFRKIGRLSLFIRHLMKQLQNLAIVADNRKEDVRRIS